jgi:predicted metal-binding membrane protein
MAFERASPLARERGKGEPAPPAFGVALRAGACRAADLEDTVATRPAGSRERQAGSPTPRASVAAGFLSKPLGAAVRAGSPKEAQSVEERSTTTGERPARPSRGRAVVMAVVAGLIALAWAYLRCGPGVGMSATDSGGGGVVHQTQPRTWGRAARFFCDAAGAGGVQNGRSTRPAAGRILGNAVGAFAMWSAMTAGMMLPGSLPAILAVTDRTRRKAGAVGGVGPAMLFTGGALAVWVASGAVAVSAQWSLDRTGVLSSANAGQGSTAAGIILLTMGLYQFAPWKRACLRQCRSPHDHLDDTSGAGWRSAAAGMRYGVVSLGCCGAFMGAMLVGGTMTTTWVGGLTLATLAEQWLPWANALRLATGAAGVAWGGMIIAAALV